MTQPDTPTGVALQYVREELSNLRTAVHDELAGMRSDISGLAGELRGHMAEQGPRLAVVEHRIGEAEKDLITIQAAAQNSDHETRIRALERARWLIGGFAAGGGGAVAAIVTKLLGG